jgi:hypothetical protein
VDCGAPPMRASFMSTRVGGPGLIAGKSLILRLAGPSGYNLSWRDPHSGLGWHGSAAVVHPRSAPRSGSMSPFGREPNVQNPAVQPVNEKLRVVVPLGVAVNWSLESKVVGWLDGEQSAVPPVIGVKACAFTQ